VIRVCSRLQEWVPTSNKRNEEMEQEVRRFAQSLKLLHKMLGELDGAIHCECQFAVVGKGMQCLGGVEHSVTVSMVATCCSAQSTLVLSRLHSLAVVCRLTSLGPCVCVCVCVCVGGGG
jgi:hypothetical protein